MPGAFGTSAQFSREMLDASLVQGMELVQPHLSPLITTVQLPDGQGNYAKYLAQGNVARPRRLYGKPIQKMDRIGTYAFSIRPEDIGGGIEMSDQEIADCNSPSWLDAARSGGADMVQYLESILISDIIESATAFDGFDGQPLYSASHNWGTSDQTPGDPAATYTTNQSNIYSAASGATDYASAAAVGTDFHGAIAQMNAWVDDKSRPIYAGSGTIYVLYNNKTAALEQYLQAYFNPESRASDDSLRDGWKFRVNLIGSPYLDATGGSTDFDWYIFRLIPGQAAPLVLQERQSIQSETWRDPMLKMNYWQYTARYGFGWTNWWQTIKVDKS